MTDVIKFLERGLFLRKRRNMLLSYTLAFISFIMACINPNNLGYLFFVSVGFCFTGAIGGISDLIILRKGMKK